MTQPLSPTIQNSGRRESVIPKDKDKMEQSTIQKILEEYDDDIFCGSLANEAKVRKWLTDKLQELERETLERVKKEVIMTTKDEPIYDLPEYNREDVNKFDLLKQVIWKRFYKLRNELSHLKNTKGEE